MSAERSYQDYVIRNGRFVGRFDAMYQDFEDPWHCAAEADALPNRMLLEILRDTKPVSIALDIGCGIGPLTRRIADVTGAERLLACDVSPTAVESARVKNPGPEYFVHDMIADPEFRLPKASVDLAILSEVVWYILPVIDRVFEGLSRLLSPDGSVVIKQAFYPPGVQKYGAEIVSSPDDVVARLVGAGLQPALQCTLLLPSGDRSWICRATQANTGAHQRRTGTTR